VLQQDLAEVSGFPAITLQPAAGAQGEFAGMLMIRAWHEAQGNARHKVIIPDTAHGTNPASAALCGYDVVPVTSDGVLSKEAVEAVMDDDVAALMVTNPNTLGLFESDIREICDLVHERGGLVYCDGANLNAILGKVRPGDMGFDVIHMNLHKTFSTPHGGGGPGAGPVGVSDRLIPFLPVPMVGSSDTGYRWLTEVDCPQSIGRLSAFMGNAGILLRAYVYMRLLGPEGMRRVADYATLNANYLMARLAAAGFQLAYPDRRASHEFIVSLKDLTKATGVTAMDMAKGLLDRGFHAPTTYFPLLVPECLLIEPTETEALEELDAFADALIELRDAARSNADSLKAAPLTLPVRRLDDVRAAKQLDLAWHPTH